MMSDIDVGRGLVKEFIKVNKLSETDLATAYGKSRVWVQRAVNGSDKGPAVNLFLLTVIRDYKLREVKEES